MTRRLGILVLAAVLLAAFGTFPADAAHPFYERMLRDGVASLELGDAETARRELEIAAFGFLDEPPLLAEALIHLGIARHELGQTQELQQTLRRLVEIEEGFGGYGQAELPATVRTDFEERILASAARELDQGRADAARLWADALLTLAPGSAPGRCLRGRAAVLGGDCDSAVPDVRACDPAPTEPNVLRDLLACHLEREEWTAARELAASLPRNLRRDRSFAPLLERLEDLPAEEEPEIPASLPDSDEPAGLSDPEGPSADDRRQALERARALLGGARTVGDLEEALELVRGVAEADPADAEAQILAGEIAYRASRWEDTVRYLERAGELEDARPEILFFLAVALYETGREERARVALEAALPALARTPFVNRYVDKILSPHM